MCIRFPFSAAMHRFHHAGKPHIEGLLAWISSLVSTPKRRSAEVVNTCRVLCR